MKILKSLFNKNSAESDGEWVHYLIFYPNKNISTGERGLHLSVPIYSCYLELSAGNYKIYTKTKQFSESE